MKESREARKTRVLKIIKNLRKAYPDAHCELNFTSPMELLAATILSAQCTDKRVNRVTPALFKRYKNPREFAGAKPEELEELIRSTGFYKNKARNIIAAAQKIERDHGGRVPATMEALTGLAGVGRKTANVLLGNAFGIPGIPVDTHMLRVNKRLGISSKADAVKMEYELMPLVPQKEWTDYSHLIIFHGRSRCYARKPECSKCEIFEFCPSGKKLLASGAGA